jgi:hypothetical protein
MNNAVESVQRSLVEFESVRTGSGAIDISLLQPTRYFGGVTYRSTRRNFRIGQKPSVEAFAAAWIHKGQFFGPMSWLAGI